MASWGAPNEPVKTYCYLKFTEAEVELVKILLLLLLLLIIIIITKKKKKKKKKK